MSDLISRKEIIDRLERVIQNGVPSEDGMHPISAETVLEVVKELSEHSTNLAEVGTDCISRQQAIETFKDCAVNGVGIDGIVDALKQLPSAQPEILACGEGELNVPDINVGDMISRHAVINAIDECYCGGEDSCGEPWIYRENAVEAIQMIEPIQPKTAKRIIGKSRGGMTLWYQCNVCNEPVDEKDAYCRGCGRRLIDG